MTPGLAGAHDPPGFIRAHTRPGRTALVPEIELHLATAITPIWQATETWLERQGVDPPYWAFAWPGGQALARHVLDNPELVRGRRVLDFAAGGGIAAIACARSGATQVDATEIDPVAVEAIRLNAALNSAAVTPLRGDVVGDVVTAGAADGARAPRWDLILCGDVCYEAPMTQHILPWLRAEAEGCTVIVADPGRAYLPGTGLQQIATYDVPTSMELEDRTLRATVLYRLEPAVREGPSRSMPQRR